MNENLIAVREMQESDISYIMDYWYTASPSYMKSMGANEEQLPPRKDFEKRLYQQLQLPYNKKGAYVIVWLFNDKPIGHSHINKINFGEEAFMHLHIWDQKNRRKGIGTKFMKLSIPYYFENFALENLFCEPYAHNPAPNKTLPKLGFNFVKQYTTIPGSINFEQEVCQYKMTKDQFDILFKK